MRPTAVIPTNGASSDTTNDPATTGSVDPAGWPILLFATASAATTAPTTLAATPNGGGSFSQLQVLAVDGVTARSLFVLYSSNMLAGTVGLDANQTCTGYNWTFVKLIQAAPYTIQSGVQGAKGTPTGNDWDTADTVTVTLGATPRSSSIIVAGAMLNVSTDSMSQGASMTELDQHSVLTPNINLHTSWNATALPTTTVAAYTQASGNNGVGGVVAVEIPGLRTMNLVGVG